MAFNLENMSVDYKKMFRMVPTQRVDLAQSGVINDFLAALTPGQLVNLFPRYYRDQLPDVGQINQYTSRLDGALSGGVKYQSNPQGGSYTPMFATPAEPTKSAQEMAVDSILQEKGIQPRTPQNADSLNKILPGIAKDPDLVNAVNEQAERFGVTPASIAMILKVENPNLNPAISGGAGNSYSGLFQIGPGELRSIGLTPEQFRGMTAAQQTKVWGDWLESVNFRNRTNLEAGNTNQNFTMLMANQLGSGRDLRDFDQNALVASGQAVSIGGDNVSLASLAEYAERVNPNNIIDIESAAEQIKALETLQKESAPLADEVRSQLDAKTLEVYDKASPEQKWNIEQAIKAVGVDEFKNRVDKMAKTTNNVGTMAELIVDDASGSRIKESQAGFRKLPIKPELRNAMEYAAEQSGVYIDVFSGGQDKQIHDAMEASGQNSAFRHNVDIKGIPGAADVILYIKDENGKVVPLSVTNPEHAPYIAKFTENISRVVPSAGIGANYMTTNGQVDPRKLHVGGPNEPGAPPATWGDMPDYLKEAHARGVAARAEDLKNDFDPLKDWEIKKEEVQLQKAKEEAEAKAQASPVTATQNEAQLANNSIPSFATGGEITPGENIAGVNTDTGKIEFMANDREKIRIDPAELENTQQILTPQSATENSAALERPITPVRERNPQPVPQPLPDPQMFEDIAAGYTAMPPSVIRAANRAKLYGENSSGLVNGHFS